MTKGFFRKEVCAKLSRMESLEKKSVWQRIKSALSQVIVYLLEQKVVFAFTLFAFVFACISTFNKYSLTKFYWDGRFEDLSYAFALGSVFAIPASLLAKRLGKIWQKYALEIALAVLGTVLGYFSYRNGFGNEVYSGLYYFGIGFAVITASLFLFIPKNNERTYFALIFKYFLFCSLMTLFVMGGLCLLAYAVQNLILGTDEDNVYPCCFWFGFLVFAINSFAFHLFYRMEEKSSGKAFKIISLYILCPIFAVLLLILYAYLVKALVLRKLPNGQINWFVSFASLFYIVFYFILREYDELPPIRAFYRFGAFAFIPLICVQLPAYFIRVNAYGFTGYRYTSLLFIIFSIITIALTFVKKGAFTKYALLLLSALILFDSVTPMNLINVAYNDQFKRMMRIMDKYEMFDHEKSSLSDYDRNALEQNISDDDRKALYESHYYITSKSKLDCPEWMERKNKEYYTNYLYFEELFGIKDEREKEELITLSRSLLSKNEKDEIDLSLFTKMRELSDNFSSSEYKDGKWIEYADEKTRVIAETAYGDYDLTDFFFSLKNDDKNGESEKNLDGYVFYSPDEKTTFCFEYIDFTYNADRKLFRRYEFRGYIFSRGLKAN